MSERKTSDARYEIDRYDASVYTEPIWESDVVVNECVFPLIGEHGERTFALAYPATRIICVRSYTLDTTYGEGKDYAITEDGRLFIPEGSAIPTREYLYLHPDSNPDGKPCEVYYPHRKVTGDEAERYEFWDESTLLSLQLLSVTYEHEKDGSIPRPAATGASLPRTMAKLGGEGTLRMIIVGDSLTCGAHSSGHFGIPPYAPAFPQMTADALALRYPDAKIDLTVAGIGGGTSERLVRDGLVEEQITSKSPDFALICYGMNDSNDDRKGFTDERFRTAIEKLIDAIREKLPECEILLVSSIYGNVFTFATERYEAHARILEAIAGERDGIAFCDPQAVERQVLRRKAFADMMADNMVHPNDFGMRLIAQTISDSIR